MKRMLRTLVPVVALGLLACTGPTRATGDPFGGTTRSGGSGGRTASVATLDAISQQFQEVTLYAIGGSSGRRAIGVVPGRTRRAFRIPWPSRSALQVEIQTVDGNRFVTPPTTVEPGETIYLYIESQITQSRLRS